MKLNSRRGTAFLDPAGRSWDWKFIPKDAPFGGQDKFSHGWCELDERVVHRADLVLVMGEDERDLLKWCTAVTFALQTKPWLREVDLWKSFVNVDLEFPEGLEPFWLE
ncbi:uncharacterized protein B0T15DRAFT_495799 [Chaetomium strumarium]|uniref:Uncharacterized protein n=1 Tax=Chaetomium strumarium TaxID=1170767 RepID=A0AAJ0GNK2_9PEZI|nr:hypothetical protein B0T15DRAFT_495799 [Chaetomium strumarium]